MAVNAVSLNTPSSHHLRCEISGISGCAWEPGGERGCARKRCNGCQEDADGVPAALLGPTGPSRVAAKVGRRR
eukprot:422451-Rhodomonas_salina.2